MRVAFSACRTLIPLVSCLFATVSCVDNAYDFDTMDREITIGGENLKVNLGSTKKLKASDLLNIEADEDGTYTLHYEFDTLSMDIDALNDIDASIDVDGAASSLDSISIDLFTLQDIPDAILSRLGDDEQVDLSAYMESSYAVPETRHEVKVRFDGIPEEIRSLKSLTLADGAVMKVTVSSPDCLLTGGSMRPDFTVDLTRLFEIGGQTEEGIDFSDVELTSENGYQAVRTYDLKGIVFDEDSFDARSHTLSLEELVSVSGAVEIEDPVTTKARYRAVPKTIVLHISVEVLGIAVAGVEGRFDYSIAGIEESAVLDGLQDYLSFGDMTVDLTDPCLDLAVSSNLGIPVKATVTAQPYKNGAKLNYTVSADIELPRSLSASQTAVQHYRLSGSGANTVIDGIIYAGVKADIARLIRDMPDRIDLVLNASTDDQAEGRIELGERYHLGVVPSVTIPVSFGRDMQFTYKDTLELSGKSDIAGIMQKNAISLSGEVMNTFPLDIDMRVEMLDEAGGPVILPVSLLIQGESTSQIDLTLKGTLNQQPARSVVFSFSIKASKEQAVLQKDQYVQATKLYLGAPGGVTLDLE